jgi:hypothetical protein
LTHSHFDHVLGSGAFAGAEIYCAPGVADHMSAGGDQLRADALKHGAAGDDVRRAITALRPPRHRVYDAIVDLGNGRVWRRGPARWTTCCAPAARMLATCLVTAPSSTRTSSKNEKSWLLRYRHGDGRV